MADVAGLGIVVGGGPAPGINGVIAAATIEARNRGLEVYGIMDGWYGLVSDDDANYRPLGIESVSRIHLTGGSILRTSRFKLTPERRRQAVEALWRRGIAYLITIGGDGMATAATALELEARGRVKVVHVPKTIDNDLPLPGLTPSFGFRTAVQVGSSIVATLMEDARTTARWYLVVTMGRSAGHMALGICKSAGATLAVIAEDFPRGLIPLGEVLDVLEGSVLKRQVMGREHGVAVIAEGLAASMDPRDLKDLDGVERDSSGNVRISTLDLAGVLRDGLAKRLEARGISRTVVDKDVGYELRCAPPNPYDLEYTRDLGYAAVKLLLEGGTGAMVSIQGGRLVPIYFREILDPSSGRVRVREVDTRTESYEVAAKYMIRLCRSDFETPERLAALAAAARVTPDQFAERFGYLGRRFRW